MAALSDPKGALPDGQPATTPHDRASLRFRHLGFGPQAVDYLDAWRIQRELHAEVRAGTVPDTVLLLEHPAVYTAGKRTAPHERPFDGTPVIDVDRGGKITWHGLGQLVGYPIIRLGDPVDVVAYVRRLEQALIGVAADLGVASGRVEGRSGVWVPADARGRERKLAAIGIRVAQGTTMHGFAINCDCDLSWFARIVPCGIPDADVTSLSAELGRDVPVAEVLPLVERHLDAAGLAGRTRTVLSAAEA
jgi:lipoyl(octanoyl) transferase